MPELIYIGLLLGLPGGLEALFWSSDDCIKAYSTWDGIAAANQLMSALLMAKMMWPLLVAPELFEKLWYIHAIVVVNASIAVATAWLLHRRPEVYARHRHAVVLTNRLMRLATTVLAAACESAALSNGMVTKVTLRPLGELTADTTSTREQLLAAVHIVRAMTLPLLVMTQGFWVFRVAHWAPIQLLNVFISCQWVLARTPCVMTLEMPSAMLLEPTCRAMSQINSLVSSLHGYHGPGTNLSACSDPIAAARAICWFGWWSYSMLTLTTGFVRLEWRVKAAWVKSFTGHGLAWGGARRWLQGLPASDAAGGGSDSSSCLRQLATWVLAVPTVLSLLWSLLLWLLPKLPLPIACQASDYMPAAGDKRFDVVTCGGSALCQTAGIWVALAILLQLVCMLFLHLRLLA